MKEFSDGEDDPILDTDGYKFINPEDVEPTLDDTETATQFLIGHGFSRLDKDDFLVGVGLVSKMLTCAEQTLSEAPQGWRFACDLDTPDDRCIVLLAQKQTEAISRDLMIVDGIENSEQIREAFMQDAPNDF